MALVALLGAALLALLAPAGVSATPRHATPRARTAHLLPAVDIGPLPPAGLVAMPEIPDQEVSAFISWAEASLTNRFEHLEPAIVSKGELQPSPDPTRQLSLGYTSTHSEFDTL